MQLTEPEDLRDEPITGRTSSGDARPILDIEDLTIGAPTPSGGEQTPVDGVSFSIFPGERVAMIGESGSGKSLTAMAALGLVPPPARMTAGRITVAGIDLATASERELGSVRGRITGLIPQEPASALNPVYSVGFQLREVIRLHRKVPARQARSIMLDLLAQTGLHPPAEIARAYAHQLSGGQLQRVMIALALAGEPELLIADEPTTALDPPTARAVLALLNDLVSRRSLCLLLISHDLSLVSSSVERVLIMYAGEIVEQGPAPAIFRQPLHPYTAALLRIAGELHDPDRHDRKLFALPGSMPPPGGRPSGCRFAPRCPIVRPACLDVHPPLERPVPERSVRCLFPRGENPR